MKRFLFVLPVLFIFGSESIAEAFRCEGGIVDEGYSIGEVLKKCGQPYFKDSRKESRLVIEGKDEVMKNVSVDEWLYNFGTQSFIRVLTFESGKLAHIKTGGYGKGNKTVEPCDGKGISLGLSRGELLMKCGEPESRKKWQSKTYPKDEAGKKRYDVSAFITNFDEWKYNLGANRFMRNFKFKDGKLIKVEEGSRGH